MINRQIVPWGFFVLELMLFIHGIGGDTKNDRCNQVKFRGPGCTWGTYEKLDSQIIR